MTSSKCCFKIFLSKAGIPALLFIYIFSHLLVSYICMWFLNILYKADGQYIFKNIWMSKMNIELTSFIWYFIQKSLDIKYHMLASSCFPGHTLSSYLPVSSQLLSNLQLGFSFSKFINIYWISTWASCQCLRTQQCTQDEGPRFEIGLIRYSLASALFL